MANYFLYSESYNLLSNLSVQKLWKKFVSRNDEQYWFRWKIKEKKYYEKNSSETDSFCLIF